MPFRSGPFALAGIALACLAGLGVRLFMLPHRELTYDEIATVYFAALPMTELWGAAGRLETNPPLFYTLAGIATRLGLSGEWLRVVSILPDIASIALGGWLARRLGGAAAGLAAAWLIAGSASMIEVSLEARAYSLLAMLGLLGLILTLHVLRDNRWRGFLALGLCEVAALYTHNVAAIMLGALNGVALLYWLASQASAPGLARRWLVTQALVALAWLFWLPSVLGQATGDLAAFWIAAPDLASLRYAVQRVVGLGWVTWPQPMADLAFAGLGGLGLLLLARRPGRERWFAVGLAVFVLAGVPVATWVISQWRPLMNGRVLLWLVPIHIVLVAVALGWLRHAGLALAAGLVVLQLHAIPFWRPTVNAERWPLVADLLREHMRPGDAIYLAPAQGALMLGHYGWRPEPYQLFGRAEWSWYQRFPGITVANAAEVPALDPGQRIWVVTRHATAEHDASVARLSSRRSEVRLLRAGGLGRLGLDLSVLLPR